MKRAWIAVVLGALLVGTLVGVVWARPNDSPQAAATTRKVTLTGADFISASVHYDYANPGTSVYCVTGACAFTAPVVFPTLNAVTVERIRLHVNDNHATEKARATITRARPSAGAGDSWGITESPPGGSGGVQTYSSFDINKVVWPSQKACITLWIGATNITVYGVTIEYHVNS